LCARIDRWFANRRTQMQSHNPCHRLSRIDDMYFFHFVKERTSKLREV